MVADNWTRSAMRDGGVVAELLLRLKEAHVTPVFLAKPEMTTVLRWGIRQPRSRSPRCDGNSRKHLSCSPISNIPLSWSDGSGGSGGDSSSPSTYVDGYESTSRKINGSKPKTEIGLGGLGATTFRVSENDKLKRIKLMHEQQPHHQDFLLPDLNMMPSQNDNNLNHCFSSHVETLYGSIRIS